MHEPLDLCVKIIQLRSYAAAKQIVENSKTLNDLPDDPMIDLVQEIQFDVANEMRTKKRGKP